MMMGIASLSQLRSVPYLYNQGSVIIGCCDDTMLFNTNMINETFELVNMLKLSEGALKELMQRAVEAVFDEGVKEDLKRDIHKVRVNQDKTEEVKQDDWLEDITEAV